MLLILALGVVLCRPYLEARRPVASLALVVGMAAGLAAFGAGAQNPLEGLHLLVSLSAGWLALSAAESFDVASLRRARAGRRGLLIAIPALLVACAAALLCLLTRAPLQAAAILIAACAAIALDPSAVRASLSRSHLPGASARLAPSIASLALGLALLATAFSGAGPGAAEGAALTFWGASSHGALTLLLGLALGLFYVGPLRLAGGKRMVLALLVSMPLAGWGLARWLEMSPLALLFAAGTVLANEGARRDLIFAVLAEMELPFTIALLLAAGASLFSHPDLLLAGGTWLLAGGLLLARPLAWSLVPATGLTAIQSLPLSPLALLLAGTLPPASTGPAPAALAIVLVLSETIWIVAERSGLTITRAGGSAA